MAWDTADEVIVGQSGRLYVAAQGTALPTTTSATLNSAFTGLGYQTEEGVGINWSREIVRHRAWQAKAAIRIDRDTETFTLSVGLLQWNETTVPLAFGGGTIATDGGSGYKYTPPQDADALARWAVVCDIDDGSDRVRFTMAEAAVVEAVDSRFQRNEMAPLPLTLEALEPEAGGDPYNIYFNETRFASGS